MKILKQELSKNHHFDYDNSQESKIIQPYRIRLLVSDFTLKAKDAETIKKENKRSYSPRDSNELTDSPILQNENRIINAFKELTEKKLQVGQLLFREIKLLVESEGLIFDIQYSFAQAVFKSMTNYKNYWDEIDKDITDFKEIIEETITFLGDKKNSSQH